jgi:hypothetical protein
MTDIRKIIMSELKEYAAEHTEYNKGYVMGIIMGAYAASVITTSEYANFMEQVAKIGKEVS